MKVIVEGTLPIPKDDWTIGPLSCLRIGAFLVLATLLLGAAWQAVRPLKAAIDRRIAVTIHTH